MLGKPTDFEITEEDMCKRLEYASEFEVSKQMYLNADYEKVQKALKASLEYSKLIEQANKQFKPTIPVEHGGLDLEVLRCGYRNTNFITWSAGFSTPHQVYRTSRL